MTTHTSNFVQEKSQQLQGLKLDDPEWEINENDPPTRWYKALGKKTYRFIVDSACILKESGIIDFGLELSSMAQVATVFSQVWVTLGSLNALTKACCEAANLSTQTKEKLINIARQIASLKNEKFSLKQEGKKLEADRMTIIIVTFFAFLCGCPHLLDSTMGENMQKQQENKSDIESIKNRIKKLKEQEFQLKESQKFHDDMLKSSECKKSAELIEIEKLMRMQAYVQLFHIVSDYHDLQEKLKLLKSSSKYLEETREDLNILWDQYIIKCLTALKNHQRIDTKTTAFVEARLAHLQERCSTYIKLSKNIRGSAIGIGAKHGSYAIGNLSVLYWAKDYTSISTWMKGGLAVSAFLSSCVAYKSFKVAKKAHHQVKDWQLLKNDIDWVTEKTKKLIIKLQKENLTYKKEPDDIIHDE